MRRDEGWSFTPSAPIGCGLERQRSTRTSKATKLRMSWTDERIDRLKAMWAEGKTASAIAEELGGVSRNAVIGKAHRLGLDSRPSPVKAGETRRRPPLRRCDRCPGRPSARPRRGCAKSRPIAAILEAAAPMPEDELKPAPAAAAAAPAAAAPAAAAERPLRVRQGRRAGHGVSLDRSRRLRAPGSGRPAGADPARAAAPPGSGQAERPRWPTRPACSNLNDRICKWPIGHPGRARFPLLRTAGQSRLPLLRPALRRRLSGAVAPPRPPPAAAAPLWRPAGPLSRLSTNAKRAPGRNAPEPFSLSPAKRA